MTSGKAGAAGMVLVLDMANIIGSVPDGWWRDRGAAAERLLTSLAPWPGRTVSSPDGHPIRLVRIVAVLEGKAKLATGPESPTLQVVRAAESGDDAIADLVFELVTAAEGVLVVTADRGLRSRLPDSAATTGPGWLNNILGR